ncbi:MAG: TonB family protein [Deltaproteobacteria bacterium]|nr:TonB family protein [Deltaproteobacteria bacterium]NIS76188.1 TonB family protein [Deltaproteobacteria bacterium]
MNNKKRLNTYIIASMFLHVTSILFLMTIKTEPLKEPRVAFVELIDIPRATEIEKALPGLIDSKKFKKTKPAEEKTPQQKPLPPFKDRVLEGKVPDLPVNPDLPPEKVMPKVATQTKSEEAEKGKQGQEASNRQEEKSKIADSEGKGADERGKVPRVKDLTPTLGKMVLAARERNTKGEGKGEGENIGTKSEAKQQGEFSEVARAGTVLTPLDNPSIQYISYFASIKRKIELVWQYPFDAIQRGIQGDLILDFSINRGGDLKNIKLVRSSGFAILDEEAIESIRKAAPFSPIPKQYRIDELNIRANFIYEMHYLKIK